ncbi:hypothetical protein [Nocardia sp. NPDC051570]|uniref:hypothetical protein n=1 Tax=Nocardia sp. NPDC051570 TaxID=3364324 RepID=UPI0037A914BA
MTVEAVAVGPSVSPVAGTLRFRDAQSGCTFHVSSPGARPDLWDEYLAGALRMYRHYRVERALEYDRVRAGGLTSLFGIAQDESGRFVAGVQARGPYLNVDEVHALQEWRGFCGRSLIRDMAAERLLAGVVEMKGAWVELGSPARSELSNTISRCAVHFPMLLGARYGFATVGTFAAGRHITTGGVVVADVLPVPYPDDRYRTVPIWWDTRTCARFATPQQDSLIRSEWLMLTIEAEPWPAGLDFAVEAQLRYVR